MNKTKIALPLIAFLIVSITCGGITGHAAETNASDSSRVTFTDAVDINGDPVSEDLLKDAKLVILNFWEPWCGPCVSEMPDLEKLYENYKDEGLLVIGVYSTFEQDEDAKALVEEDNITYPILKCSDTLYTLEQSYIPATYLLDGDGNILTEDPYIGAMEYEKWEEIVKTNLE